MPTVEQQVAEIDAEIAEIDMAIAAFDLDDQDDARLAEPAVRW